MKEVKRRILFFLTIVSAGSGKEVSARECTYQELYTFIPFVPSSIRSSIMELRNDRLVATYVRSGQTLISITSQGKERVYDLFPAFRGTTGRWDGVWTIIVFQSVDGLEQAFRKTRELVRSFGFFQLHDGVYVRAGEYPSQLKESTVSIGTFAHLTVFESRKLLFTDEAQLLRQAFDVDALEREVQGLLVIHAKLGSYSSGPRASRAKARKYLISFLERTMDYAQSYLPLPEKYIPRIMKDNNIIELLQVQAKLVLLQE